MKRALVLTTAIALLLSMTSCSQPVVSVSETTTIMTSEATTSATTVIETSTEESASDTTTQTEMETDMVLRINDRVIQVEWEDNESVEALKDLTRSGTITIEMSMYGGFEQVGSIGSTLPRNDEQTTTSPGDIVLYQGDQIVVFYGSNSWAYTRIGRIQNMSEEELTTLLGSADVTITISNE